MQTTTIRPATSLDTEAIRNILNAEIRGDVNVWHEVERSPADMAAWLSERQNTGMPVFVAEREKSVIGYASYGPFRPHSGYRATVEHSIYVDRDQRGTGAGRALLNALLTEAQNTGVHAIIGGIEAGNTASIALHRNLGFEETGRLPEVGRKFDRWLTLVFMQRTFS